MRSVLNTTGLGAGAEIDALSMIFAWVRAADSAGQLTRSLPSGRNRGAVGGYPWRMASPQADELQGLSRSEVLRASPRMFESDLLDKLSRVHPAVPRSCSGRRSSSWSSTESFRAAAGRPRCGSSAATCSGR